MGEHEVKKTQTIQICLKYNKCEAVIVNITN